MNVGQLKQELSKYSDDLEVRTQYRTLMALAITEIREGDFVENIAEGKERKIVMIEVEYGADELNMKGKV